MIHLSQINSKTGASQNAEIKEKNFCVSKWDFSPPLSHQNGQSEARLWSFDTQLVPAKKSDFWGSDQTTHGRIHSGDGLSVGLTTNVGNYILKQPVCTSSEVWVCVCRTSQKEPRGSQTDEAREAAAHFTKALFPSAVCLRDCLQIHVCVCLCICCCAN